MNRSVTTYSNNTPKNCRSYHVFGMQMPGRFETSEGYRYGFQGQEKDNELKGEGNSLNYEYRMHDPRLGRFFAVDPLEASFPWNSPYAFSENMVIHAVELEGLEASVVNAEAYDKQGNSTGTYTSIGGDYDVKGTLSDADMMNKLQMSDPAKYPKGCVVNVYIDAEGGFHETILTGADAYGYTGELENEASIYLQRAGITNTPQKVAEIVGYYQGIMDFVNSLPEDTPWYYDLNNAISNGGHQLIAGIVDNIPLYEIGFGLLGENAYGDKLSDEERMIYIVSGTLKVQKSIVAKFFKGKSAGTSKGSSGTLANQLVLASGKLHKHHVFPQQYRAWFAKKGINIDDYSVIISQDTHLKGIHGKGVGYLKGQWNQRWGNYIKENPNATPYEIFYHGESMLKDYGLEHLQFVPYKK